MRLKKLTPKGLDDIEKIRMLFSVSDNLCNALAVTTEWDSLTNEVSIGCVDIDDCKDGCILHRVDTNDKFNAVSWLVDNGYITKAEALGLTLDSK